MSNGWLTSPSTASVSPCPGVRYDEKSTECTFCADASSTPRGVVVPLASTAPDAECSSQGSASVASVTTVAFFGPPGR